MYFARVTSPRLGAFVLVSPHATGGMSEVWRAVHVPTGERTAIKLSTASEGQAAARASALRAEIRALARLDHPHVLHLHDAGEVDAEAAALLGGRVLAGSPWLASEFAAGGTLADRVGLLSAFAVRDLLVALLSALGHAHARGLVHRDLKPSNILFVGDPAVPKLADFGVAWTRGLDEPDRPVRAATLPYMAPEQFSSRTRVEGPWTDLYQVGCVAWEVLTGEPPFPVEDAVPALAARLAHRLPTFSPRIAVPEGLEAWLLTCLAADPAARYVDAADAQRALASLAWVPGPTPAPVMPRVSVTATTVPRFLDPSPNRPIRFAQRTASVAPVRLAPTVESAARLADGPFLMAWRPLGLAGLQGALEGLENLLLNVAESAAPQVVFVTDAGSRVSQRVVEAFAQKCVEAGACTVVRVPSSADPSGRTAFDRAVVRLLGSSQPQSVEDALHDLGVDDRVVAELWRDRLAEPLAGEVGGLSAFRHLVDRLAAYRPVVVVFNEGMEADVPLSFASASVLARRRVPVLTVVTIPDGAGSAGLRGVEADLIEAGASLLSVSPLTPDQCAAALSRVVPVHPSTLGALVQAAAADPLLALAELARRHRQGEVAVTDRGLSVRRSCFTGDPPPAPSARSAELFATGTSAERVCLRLAALLAPEIDVAWWQRAAGHLDAGPVDGLHAQLFALGLGTTGADGMLLVRGAVAATWNDDSAEGPERFHAALGATAGLSTERVVHDLRAGRFLDVWQEVESAVRHAAATSAPRALRLLSEFEAAVGRSGLPAHDARVLRVRGLEARVLDTTGRLTQALRLVDDLCALGRAIGDGEVQADALADGAHFELRFGRVTAAADRIQRALVEAVAVGSPACLGRVWYRAAWVAMIAHDAPKAREALAAAARFGHPYEGTRFGLLDASLAIEDGHASLARSHLERVGPACLRQGDPRGLLLAELALGKVSVLEGDLLRARACFRSATQRAGAANDPGSLAAACVGMVRCALMEEDDAAAERQLALVSADPPEGLTGDLVGLASMALDARHVEIRPQLWAVLDRLENDGFLDVEIRHFLMLAERRAARAGAAERAAAIGTRVKQHQDLLMSTRSWSPNDTGLSHGTKD